MKVAIMGGGPGGLSAAIEAAKRGAKVTIFEKRRIGEQINCAEGFFDLLKLLDPPQAGVVFKVQQLDIIAASNFEIDCSKLNMWMIDRSKWQKELAKQAISLGCQIFDNTPVTESVYTRLQKEYDWIIDASGFYNASQCQNSYPSMNYAYTAQYTLLGDFSGLYGKIKAVVEPHYCGYYWIFPKAKDCAHLGIGWLSKKGNNLKINEELKRIIKKENYESYQVQAIAGGPIPVTRRKNLVYGKTILIGDAAGLASPLHGGGIDTACISGILAARSIEEGTVNKFSMQVGRLIGVRLSIEAKLLDVWQRLGYQAFNDLVASSLGQTGSVSRLQKIRNSITQEAAVTKYLLSGNLHANWDTGIVTEDMPFSAKAYLKQLIIKEGLFS